MKKITLFFLTICGLATYAQETETPVISSDSTWILKGNITILGSQSSFTNWQAGGANNFAVNGLINYDANYKKDRWNWDNKLIANYGFTRLEGGEQQKTDDRFEINLILGLQATGEWFYSAFLNFKTQFDAGLDPNDTSVRISQLLSPAYLQVGPGMMWKKNDNFKVNIAPATSRFIFVNSKFTEFGESFGVAQGETMRFEFGASINGYYKFNLMENFSIENILNLYSNYLEDPKNVDIDYQINVVLKVNRLITTNLLFHTMYDDNAFKGFQTRHTLGVGLTANF